MRRAMPFAIVMAAVLAACQSKGESKPVDAPDTPAVKPASKKAVLVIAPDKFRDEELFDTRKVLEGAGVKTSVASTAAGEVTGMLGGKAKPDLALPAVYAADWDAVVFVGGTGAQVYFEDAVALALAKDAFAKGKVAAAICIAPSILANAGVLQGRKATAYESEKGNLTAKGATWSDGPVVTDGKVVTGNGPKAAVEFGNAIVKAL